jgi:hypothetical protein
MWFPDKINASPLYLLAAELKSKLVIESGNNKGFVEVVGTGPW